MRASRLFLHIGLHKTGTTAIQHGLYAQHDALRARGYCYPRPEGLEAHHALAFLAMRSDRRPLAEQRRRFSAAVAALRDQAGCDTLILSSEAFSEAIDWQVAAALRELFDAVTVIVYLRRQDLRNESSYNQNVKQDGETRPIAQIDTYLNDFGELLDRVAFHFGRRSIMVRLYEEERLVGGNVFLDFLAAVGLPEPHGLAPVTERINPSLGLLSLETMLRLNRHQPRRRDSLVRWVAAEIARRHPGRDVPMVGRYLAPRARHLLLQRCAAGNAYVARTYLGRASGDLFQPPAPPAPPPGAEAPAIDVDQLAAELWAAWQASPESQGEDDEQEPAAQIGRLRQEASGGPGLPLDVFRDEYDAAAAILVLPRGQNFRFWVTPRYRHHFEGREFEAATQRLVARLARRAATFVDVGAHYGFYSLLAGAVNPGIRIIACEPIPETAAILERNLRENGLANATIERCAVSDRSGAGRINRSLSSDNCSFVVHPNAATIGRARVRTETLDDLLRAVPGGPLLVKIDTDGHEMAILAGMGETLRRFPDLALIVELNPKMMRASGWQPADLLDRLDALGLAVFLLDDRSMQAARVTAATDLASMMDLARYANLYCRPKPLALSLAAFSHSAGLAGSERSLLELLRELVDDHWCLATAVLPERGPLADALARLGIGVLVSGYGGWCSGDHRPVDQPDWALHDLRELLASALPALRQIDPDIVWTQTLTIPWGAVAAFLLRRPHVWSIGERGDPAHGLGFRIPREEALALVERWSDHVFCGSPSLVRDLFPGRPVEAADWLWRHIPTPIEVDAAAGRAAWRQPGASRLLMVGTLSPGKGQADAIRAVRRLVDDGHAVELVLVGGSVDPAYPKALAALVGELGLGDQVRYLGRLLDPYSLLAAADIVLVCSRGEGFCRVAVEAMLLGRAVVYAESGALRDYMTDGETGLAYPPGDVGALASRIAELVADGGRRGRIGETARERAGQLFTPAEYGGKVHRKLLELKARGWVEKLARCDFLALSLQALLGERSRVTGRIERSAGGMARDLMHHDLVSKNPGTGGTALLGAPEEGAWPELDVLRRRLDLEEALRVVAAERARAKLSQEASQREIEALRAERDALVRANENAEQACAVLRQCCAGREQDLVGHREQAPQPAASRGLASADIAACQEQVRQLELLIAKLRSSTSWRLTAPLRAMKTRLRAMRGASG